MKTEIFCDSADLKTIIKLNNKKRFLNETASTYYYFILSFYLYLFLLYLFLFLFYVFSFLFLLLYSSAGADPAAGNAIV